MVRAFDITDPATGDLIDVVHPERGEFNGNGLAHDASGRVYDPLAGAPDPDDPFWLSSKPLAEIRRYARSAGVRVNPWALLATVLTRLSVALPPNVVADPLNALQPMPVQLFLALLGGSGAGKGVTERAAMSLIPDIRGAATHIPASGEGIPTMYAIREKREDGGTYLKPVACRALLSMPEITHLGGAVRRIGSTLVSTLLSAYQGEPIGAANRSEADRYEIPRNGYRLCLITGVQPSNAGILLDEAPSGLPQRFLWFDVRDPETPLKADGTKEVLDSLHCFPFDTSKLPKDPDTGVLQAYYNPGADGINKPGEYPKSYKYVTYPKSVTREFEVNRIMTNRGIATDPLDAHRLMVTARVAALLALLDHPDAWPNVNEREWANAKTIMEHSTIYRTQCIHDMKHARSHVKADEYEIVENARSEVRARGIGEAKERILTYLQDFGPTRTGVKGWKIKNHVTNAYRDYAYDALAILHDEGQIGVCGTETEKVSGNSWRLKT